MMGEPIEQRSGHLGIAYLKDVLERTTNGHPMYRIDDLLPWNWKSHLTVNQPTCEKWTPTELVRAPTPLDVSGRLLGFGALKQPSPRLC